MYRRKYVALMYSTTFTVTRVDYHSWTENGYGHTQVSTQLNITTSNMDTPGHNHAIYSFSFTSRLVILLTNISVLCGRKSASLITRKILTAVLTKFQTERNFSYEQKCAN